MSTNNGLKLKLMNKNCSFMATSNIQDVSYVQCSNKLEVRNTFVAFITGGRKQWYINFWTDITVQKLDHRNNSQNCQVINEDTALRISPRSQSSTRSTFWIKWMTKYTAHMSMACNLCKKKIKGKSLRFTYSWVTLLNELASCWPQEQQQQLCLQPSKPRYFPFLKEQIYA